MQLTGNFLFCDVLLLMKRIIICSFTVFQVKIARTLQHCDARCRKWITV